MYGGPAANGAVLHDRVTIHLPTSAEVKDAPDTVAVLLPLVTVILSVL
jgi:hypothetical protein